MEFRICGAGAGTFCSESEPKPRCFPGAVAIKIFHGSTSLVAIFLISAFFWCPLGRKVAVIAESHWNAAEYHIRVVSRAATFIQTPLQGLRNESECMRLVVRSVEPCRWRSKTLLHAVDGAQSVVLIDHTYFHHAETDSGNEVWDNDGLLGLTAHRLQSTN